MSSMSIDKVINNEYASSALKLCKFLKAHATNILLLPDGKILLQPVINGIRNYMIVNPKIDYSNFIYTYFSLSEISKYHSSFRKTKSKIYWETEKGITYLIIENEDEEPYKSPIMSNPEALSSLLNATYKTIPDWNGSQSFNEILSDEPSSQYTDLGREFLDDMVNKKLCELKVHGQSILVSRPFLGDLKKTEWVGYRLVEEDDTRIVLKFKQVEELGNIYTYAAFLKY